MTLRTSLTISGSTVSGNLAKATAVAEDNARAEGGGLLGAASSTGISNSVLSDDHAVAVVPHGPFLLDWLSAPARKNTDEGAVLVVGGVRYGDRPTPLPAASTATRERSSPPARSRISTMCLPRR